MGFGTNMGWEMGLEPPPPSGPSKKVGLLNLCTSELLVGV